MKLLLLLIILACAGCVQRVCDYDIIDPNGLVTGRVHYKSNFFATDTSADWVRITLPDGTIIEFRKFIQDNDSLRMITPYGIVETEADNLNER